MLIFRRKVRLGWREVERHELTGADGAPLMQSQPELTIVEEVIACTSPAQMTDEELNAAVAEHAARAARSRPAVH
jgi:hypothetical protein